ALADLMQDILQVLDYTCYGIGPTAVADNANVIYCFVNNIHVDYAELMWEGIYYSLHHPVTSIPYPRFNLRRSSSVII
ncbi:hypothetical protein Tco_0482706, partial [Tanacetum coccineum]